MAEAENLEIIIDVFDSYSDELSELLAQLIAVETVAESVEDITIDVDVRGEKKLDALAARMAMIQGGEALSRGRRGSAMQTAAFGRGGDFARNTERAAESSSLLDLRMSDLHNALAKLVPLILTFIGALPALIGALVALGAAAISAAGALAAIGAIGFLGAAAARGGRGGLMEGATQILRELQQDFLDAFLPLAERLQPVFERALDGLDRLFQEIANRGDSLVALTDVAEGFGDFVMQWLPDALRNMALMAEAFAPLFGQLGAFLNSFSILQALSGFMADVLPSFLAFLDILIDIVPSIFRLSIGFLDVVSVVLRAIEIFGDFVGMLGLSNEAIGILVASLLTAWTAANLFSLQGLKNVVLWLAAVPGKIAPTVAALKGYTVSALTATTATSVLTTALTALLGVVTLGLGFIALGATAEFVTDKFFNTADSINQATAALREFESANSRFRGGDNPFGADSPSVRRGSVSSSGGVVLNYNYNGSSVDDAEEGAREAKNALYRYERPRRKR